MRSTAATPLGLRGSSLLFPKVAEYSNLGLWGATPSELHTTNRVGGIRVPHSKHPSRSATGAVRARNRLLSRKPHRKKR